MDITPEDIINPPPETYDAEATCQNCGNKWTVKISRGIPVWIRERNSDIKCSHCGCDDVLIESPDKW